MGYVPLVREYRGGLIDLTHMGYIAVVDEHSKLLYSAGDAEQMVYYRSASKPIQALPVIERRLDEQFGLAEAETAIMAGSHMGEPFHIAALESMHKKADLKESDLIMKPTTPSVKYAYEDWVRAGLPKRKLYHNCSGKHSALMLTQRALGGPIGEYWKVDSLAQHEVLRVISVLSEWPAERTTIGVDGCGVPVFAVPMRSIATAFKNLACPDRIRDASLAEAAARFVPRFHRHPEMMRGTGDLCTLLNEDENIVAKGGANAAYALGLKREKIGIALKLIDGGEAARPFVIRKLLEDMGYDNRETLDKLSRMCDGVIVNDNDTPVGELEWAVSAPPLSVLRNWR